MYYVDGVAFRNSEAARQRSLNPFPKTWVVQQLVGGAGEWVSSRLTRPPWRSVKEKCGGLPLIVPLEIVCMNHAY